MRRPREDRSRGRRILDARQAGDCIRKCVALLQTVGHDQQKLTDLIKSLRKCVKALIAHGGHIPRALELQVRALAALGDAYLGLVGVSGNEELAIRSYEHALSLAYKAKFRKRWRTGKSDEIDLIRARAAVAYDRRRLGDKLDNLNTILVYTDSLAIEEKRDAELLARAKFLRGKAFRDRGVIAGLGPLDWKIAHLFLSEAVKILNRAKKHSTLWAEVHLELGKTIIKMSSWDPETKLSAARGHLRNALTVFKRRLYPVLFSKVHATLGDYHFRAASRSASQAHERRAHENYSRALRTLSDVVAWREWAELKIALCDQLCISPNKAQLSGLIDHLEEVLSKVSNQNDEPLRLEALSRLGAIWFSRKNWSVAAHYLSQTFDCARGLLDHSGNLLARRATVQSISTWANCLAYCHLRDEKLDDALLATEGGKTLLLRAALELPDLDAAILTHAQRRTHPRLARRIRKLQAKQYGGMNFLEDSRRLVRLHGNAEELRKTYAALLPRGLSIDQVTPNAEGCALVIPLITDQGSALFILQAGDRSVSKANVVELGDLRLGHIQEWLITGNSVSHAWFETYKRMRDGGAEEADRWRRTVSSTCELLDESIGRHLRRRLKELGVSKITIVPSAGLQFLPLHAASWKEEGLQRYFADEFCVTYAPSLHVLRTIVQRRKSTDAGKLLIAGVSEYAQLKPIPHVRAEIHMVSKILGAPYLLDSKVTKNGLRKGLSGAAIAHIACHAEGWAVQGNDFRMSWTPQPVLHLHEGGLSFEDILTDLDLRNAQLITLSACDTGMVDTRLEWDEFEGLPHVLLQAGASTIVSSLWSVDDRSTSLLMHRFYLNIRENGASVPEALREAQSWLRTSTRAELLAVYTNYMKSDSETFADDYSTFLLAGGPKDKPYAEPVFWAPFVVTGQ